MAEGQDEKAVEVMVAELSQLLLREINETSQK
jgi:hypothetical protein